MKKQSIFKTVRNLLLILGCMTFGLIQGQMSENVTESSVLSSFKDKSLEWGPCPAFMPEGCNIAVLHGDPSKNNSDILFKVNGKSDIPNHWHNSSERMVLLSGELQVTYQGESTKTLKKGNYAFGPAKKPHTAKCISKDPCILYIGFGEPLDAFEVVD